MSGGVWGFMKKFVDGHRIVSTGDLTLFQIAEARKEGRIFIDNETGLGWVALPWELTTAKDKQRESDLSNRKQPSPLRWHLPNVLRHIRPR